MVQAYIIHGAFGHPEENWIPWLRTQLDNQGCQVKVPQFPTPDRQTLDNWLEVFSPYLNALGPDTLLIGHSLGPAFILRVLERYSVQVQAAFLVSGFTDFLNHETFDQVNASFIAEAFDWETIRQRCERFSVLYGDDDPYVPTKEGKYLARQLNATETVINGGGHLNAAAGYTTFPRLLSQIEQEL